jgi:alkylation response protein AidB-like acyl-CoA dehydrogenase
MHVRFDVVMAFTDEQVAFRDAIRDFAARECGTREQRDGWLDADEEEHSTPLYAKLAELGWLETSDHVTHTLLFEELHRGLVPVKAIGPTTTVKGCYERFASAAQREDALARIAEGKVMAISISEPGAGSDVAAISCKAVRGDGGWIVNGQKTWCSYAHIADRTLLVARTSREDKPHQGLTIFEVPGGAEGVQTHRIPTMGGREVNDVFYTDCFLEEDAVVGEIGQGFRQIMSGLDGERLLAAAVGLGLAQRALDDTLAYVKQRKQFGQPIGTFQALRHRIADIATEIECARLITYEVAERMDAGDRTVSALTSMAKVKASEIAKHAALEGLQMMGGYGYATEYDMEGLVRFALVIPIYAGTNEIQRDIISASLGLR